MRNCTNATTTDRSTREGEGITPLLNLCGPSSAYCFILAVRFRVLAFWWGVLEVFEATGARVSSTDRPSVRAVAALGSYARGPWRSRPSAANARAQTAPVELATLRGMNHVHGAGEPRRRV